MSKDGTNANFTWSSFLGGEWSPYAQGRIDHPDYRKAMNSCLNGLPLETGAWQRRSGFREAGITRGAMNGIVRPFYMANNLPVYMELTWDSSASLSWLRFWSAPYGQVGPADGTIMPLSDAQDTIVAISTATPAVVQTTSAHSGWATGDYVTLYMKATGPVANAPTLQGRQFQITKIDSTHFSLVDALTNASVIGVSLNFTATGSDYISHISQIQMPFTSLAEVRAVRFVQANNLALILHQNHPSGGLFLTAMPPSTPVFTYVANVLGNVDGPYLDPPPGASQTGNGLGSVNNATSTPTFTITDGSYSFVSSDVGRQIRLWSMPAAWNGSTAYTKGEYVSLYNVQYVCTANNTGVLPPSDAAAWAIVPFLAQWFYGTITTVSSTSAAVVSLNGGVNTTNNGSVIDTYQLGAYTSGQYPSCGTYHEGRIWLGGAIAGRFDSSVAGFQSAPTGFVIGLTQEFVYNLFSPSTAYDQVLDESAISYLFEGTSNDQIYWMQPDQQGIQCGTLGGEWLIQASNINNVLSPTSIQAHRVTKYNCANIEPARTGIALIFIQALGRRVMEYIADAFTQRFSARHLNEFAKHLTTAGVREIAYQEELAPVVWVCNMDGSLVGCTYRRISQFATEPPLFTGWHRHEHGAGRSFQSICVGPNQAGTLDSLCAITEDTQSKNYIEIMLPLQDENAPLTSAWYVDAGLVPTITDNNTNTLTIYGAWSLGYIGQAASVWLAGLYCGEFVVSLNGTISVPYGSDPENLLTRLYLQESSVGAGTLGAATCDLGAGPGRYYVPCALGVAFASQGQLVRPQLPDQLRTEGGSGFGKAREVFRYAMLAANSISNTTVIGIDFSDMYNIIFYEADDNTATSRETMFSGIVTETLNTDFNYDNMICWSIAAPYPLTICALSGFVTAEDR
jgi:hypothetical protein